MIGVERGHTEDGQLLVLWTWLLEGYVPVAHIVAEVDELETLASSESGDAPWERPPHVRSHLARKKAA